MKTHVVKVTTADGVQERKVDATERLLLRSNGNLESWPVSKLGSVTISPYFGSTPTFNLIHADGRGEARSVPRGVLELGDERWPIADLAGFELALIPPKPEPAPPPRVVRVSFNDGRQPVDIYSASATISGTPVDARADHFDTWGASMDDVAAVEALAEAVVR